MHWLLLTATLAAPARAQTPTDALVSRFEALPAPEASLVTCVGDAICEVVLWAMLGRFEGARLVPVASESDAEIEALLDETGRSCALRVAWSGEQGWRITEHGDCGGAPTLARHEPEPRPTPHAGSPAPRASCHAAPPPGALRGPPPPRPPPPPPQRPPPPPPPPQAKAPPPPPERVDIEVQGVVGVGGLGAGVASSAALWLVEPGTRLRSGLRVGAGSAGLDLRFLNSLSSWAWVEPGLQLAPRPGDAGVYAELGAGLAHARAWVQDPAHPNGASSAQTGLTLSAQAGLRSSRGLLLGVELRSLPGLTPSAGLVLGLAAIDRP